ncbi:glycosyltransferase [Flavobacteriales bacterium]|nr:glycosyltransferase [Flavobacteriales bacterium]
MISVILPVYNGETYLIDAVDSVLNQDLESFEFVIIDDCSSDRSKEILSKYQGDTRVKLIYNKENLGLFTTLNKGILEANGTFIKIWAQDDIMMPGCLATFQRAFHSHPKSSFIWSQSIAILSQDSLQHLASSDSASLGLANDVELWNIEKCLRHFWYCGSLHGNISLFGFSKEIWSMLGGFNTALIYSGDIDFTERALHIGHPVCIPNPTVWLRNHDEQLSKSIDHLHYELLENISVFANVRRQTIARTNLSAYAIQCEKDRQIPYLVSNAFAVVRKNPRRGMLMLHSIGGNRSISSTVFFWIRAQLLRRLAPHRLIKLY